ncbi:DJ-1/PfpI family protein [Streptomyces puniciscabiei]|uniref:DJ-1/PfpI family protein n=1 Tax=Streptomyces puniciscabiei TaxID=164348 RepID=UPI0022772429|nr:DJ-1/PfpI family protein [Streptomyces puniciscabiei]
MVEAFASADELGGRYRVQLASEDGAGLVASAGTRLSADLRVDEVRESCDVLVITGGSDGETLIKDDVLLDAVQQLNEKARCTATVCTGAFLLVGAGLLDGRRAVPAELAAAGSAFSVRGGPAGRHFVRDGRMMTSAGVSAGIDLSLTLVEDHYGAQVARAVAKDMVVFMQRPGGPFQFSVRSRAPHSRQEMLRRVLDAVVGTSEPGSA